MRAGSVKFLIVDDSLIAVGKLTGIVETLGHSVVGTADTGKRALEVFRECRPDLITMDITMPDMDGIEATELILAENPSAKIIMVTSHGQEHMVMKALKAGAKGYVLKPVHADKLADVIRKLRVQAF